MARGGASAHKDNQEALSQGEPKSSKRRCVQSACVPCRKRKSKCDGGTPVCATCIAVYKTECFYDPESESRRSKHGFISSTGDGSAGTKRDASPTTSAPSSESALTAESLINSFRRLPEEEVLTFISLVRREPQLDIPTLAETWRRTVTLTPNIPLDGHSLEDDLSVLLGKPAVTLTGQSRHFGHSAGLGLVPEDEDFGGGQLRKSSVHIEREGSTWTNVTNDLGFVENLFALYFTWSHPFYVLFSRECFYKDFKAGRDKYCSSLLVNAICAYACHLTDDPAGRTDPSNFRTAGDHFFAEAKRILFEDETPSLTTTQALCIMSMREPSTGRDTSGFNYIGRCIHMCVELGLHLNNSASPVLRLTPSEIEVRKVTFWGCFIIDTVYSLVTGRIAQLPRAAITLDKPIMDEAAGLPEANAEFFRVPPGVVTTRIFLQEFATLSELVNDNNYMFFAPREPLNSHRIVGCYSKYKAWYQKLPVALGIEGVRQPEPHTLVLHMLYHTLIVHLFRPMLKVDFVGSDVQPREACIEAANNVSDIVRTYRKFYSFRVAHLAIPHILLTICIVHLLYSRDNKISYVNLVEGLQGLEDIHECHYFGARSFRILHTLASTWDLPWPDELRDSKLIPLSRSGKPQGTLSPPADPLLMAPNTFTTTGNRFGSNVPYSQMGLLARRESLSMFNNQASLQLATHPALTRSGSVPALRHQSPTVGRTPTRPYAPMSFHVSQSTSSVLPNVTSPANSSSAHDCTEPFFWTPIPGMPGPIVPRSSFQEVGPMDLGSVIQPADMVDRGFKMSSDWQSSHLSGFVGGTGPGFSAPSHESQNAVAYLHRGSASYTPASSGEQYQRQTPQNSHQGQQEGYEGAPWYSNQMS